MDLFPLCVDIDGTLIKSDSLLEAVVLFSREHPFKTILLPFWILRGKAYFKERIFSQTKLDVSKLPYHSAFLSFLKEQHENGKTLVLATNTHNSVAKAIADHLGIFSDIIAWNSGKSIAGTQKLLELQRRFGEKKFEYAGNDHVDLPIWKEARSAIIVSASNNVLRKVRRGERGNVVRVFEREESLYRSWLKALRPYQWLKNTLLFVPVITSHRFTDATVLFSTTIAIIAFCCFSSGVYLWNDLCDLPFDRQHPRKRNRPLAAGNLPITLALFSIIFLFLLAFFTALFLPTSFIFLLIVYGILTTIYSLWAKRKAILDVFILASLYTLRIAAGAAAIEVKLSLWLLFFALFFFLGLAFLKRYSECKSTEREGQKLGRGYTSDDASLLLTFGVSSAFLSLFVLAQYITSPDVVILYSHPQYLWFLIPVLLYWILRLWFLAHHERLPDDPLLFSIHDLLSYVLGAIIIIVMYLAA